MSASPIGDPRRSSVPGLLAALGVSAIVIALLGLRTPTPILSYDDIFRTRFAHDWAIAPYFFTERLVWLPFPLMATGLAMRVTGEALGTALAVNLAATLLAIVYVHRITDRWFGPLAAWTAASLFGLTPWVVFLSLSRYSEPVMLAATAAGVYYWLRWSEAGRARDLAGAAVALGAGVLTRYEVWPLGLALPIHVATVLLRRRRTAAPGPRPGLSGLWSLFPAALMTVWAAKNLVVYGTPVYGGAFGFLPDGSPAGPLGGAVLTLRYLWQLSPIIAALGLAGVFAARRRAPLLAVLAALAAVIPWYTVSLFSVEVALHIRLMLLPLMLLAPFAGGLVARIRERWPGAAALVLVLIAAQLVVDLGLAHPGHELPMTRLALQLERSGTLDRFDSIYVESPRPLGYPDEVRVATNFRRSVRVLAPASGASPWRETEAEAVLVLNDGRIRPGGPTEGAFVVSRVGAMTAWGLCNLVGRGEPRAEWLDVSGPSSLRPGARGVVRVTLRNAGSRPWRATACGPSIEARWLGPPTAREPDAGRLALARHVAPGDTMTAEVPIQAPVVEGEYRLDLSLVDGVLPPPGFERSGNTVGLGVRVGRD